jgi:hypothetical protein
LRDPEIQRFWEKQDGTTRARQRTRFLKDLAILGGLVLEVSEG